MNNINYHKSSRFWFPSSMAFENTSNKKHPQKCKKKTSLPKSNRTPTQEAPAHRITFRMLICPKNCPTIRCKLVIINLKSSSHAFIQSFSLFLWIFLLLVSISFTRLQLISLQTVKELSVASQNVSKIQSSATESAFKLW